MNTATTPDQLTDTVLCNLEDGRTVTDFAEALRELVAAIRTTGGSGKITLKFDIVRPQELLDTAMREVLAKLEKGTGLKALIGRSD